MAYIYGISKSDFKNAVGALYREGIVTPGRLETTLIPEESRTEENFENNRISKKTLLKKSANFFSSSSYASSKSSSELKAGENAKVEGEEVELTESQLEMQEVRSKLKGKRLANLLQGPLSGPRAFKNRDESKTIFVGNLPFTINEKILENAVTKTIGKDKIASIRLIYDEETMKPKGFGYVEFLDENDIPAAMVALKNLEVMGRALRVDLSESSRKSPTSVFLQPEGGNKRATGDSRRSKATGEPSEDGLPVRATVPRMEKALQSEPKGKNPSRSDPAPDDLSLDELFEELEDDMVLPPKQEFKFPRDEASGFMTGKERREQTRSETNGPREKRPQSMQSMYTSRTREAETLQSDSKPWKKVEGGSAFLDGQRPEGAVKDIGSVLYISILTNLYCIC